MWTVSVITSYIVIFTTGHEVIVSQLTHFLQAAGLVVQNNVGVGGRQRPADTLQLASV